MLIEMIINQKFEPESLPFARPEEVVINFNHSQAFSFGEIDMGNFKRTDIPLCACGCGEPVKRNGKGWNKYINGHNNRGKDKYAEEKSKPAPLCKCGYCGGKAKWNPNTNRYNKFVNGHENRGKNHPNFNKKHAEEKAKPAPLCACGCGKLTKWCPQKNRYNEYIYGHNACVNNPSSIPSVRRAISKRMKKNNPAKSLKVIEKILKTKEERGIFIQCSERMKENNPMNQKEVVDKAIQSNKIRGRYRKSSERMLSGGAALASSFNQNPSKPQVKLFKLIKLFYPGAILNYPSLNYSIDIAIPDLMIAIEYDGSYWHQNKEVDDKRQRELETIGWNFLRYVDYVPSTEDLKKDLRFMIG